MNQIPVADARKAARAGSVVRGRGSMVVVAALLVAGWAFAPVPVAAEAPRIGRESASPAGTDAADGAATGDAAGLIVTYADGTSSLERATALRLVNMVMVDDLERGLRLGEDMEALDLEAAVPVARAEDLARLAAAMPFVESAEPNHIVSVPPLDVRPTSSPEIAPTEIRNLPANGILWGLDRIDQRSTAYDRLYNYNETGAGVRAYIFDTGINPAHPEFATPMAAGYTVINDGNGTNDCDFHGTHVAGTVGGSFVGVAKGVTLVPMRVLDCGGFGSYAGIIDAIDWVLDNHPVNTPAVANLSLGGGYSSALNSAIQDLVDEGITVVVAAGNADADACNVSPASAPSAITVGASTIDDARAGFSNFGACNDLYAPGEDIVSAWYGPEGGYVYASGTSMAAPHVAGVVARMLSADPSLTPTQVWSRLQSIATPFTSDRAGDANELLYAPAALGAPTVGVAGPATPVSTRTVEFAVTFSRSVSGLTAGDVSVTGTAEGCLPSVSGSGTAWVVTATCTSDGTVAITVAADAGTDVAGITGPLLPVASDEVTIDATVPSATISRPASTSDSRSVTWDVTFDEPVTGLTSAGFTITGTAAPCALALSGSGTTYEVAADCDRNGTATLRLDADVAVDAAGNYGPAAAVTSSVTIETPFVTPIASLLVPALVSSSRSVALQLRLSSTIPVAAQHFSNTGTARDCSFLPTGSGTAWTVLTTCATDGTLVVRFDPPTVAATTALPVTISSTAPTRIVASRKRFTVSALAALANVTIPSKSRVRATVSRATSRNCRVTGSRIVRTRKARCVVTMTVTPPNQRAFKKKIVITP